MPIDDPWLPTPVNGVIADQRYVTPTRVCRMNVNTEEIPGGGDETTTSLTTLDNVAWTEIRDPIGDDPGYAKLRYRLGLGDPDAPYYVEDALSAEFWGAKVIDPGDRIVIFATRPDGKEEPIFDGTAIVFGGSHDDQHESATITCLGIGFQLRSMPITGATYRNNDTPTLSANDRETDLETHFNPKGIGNCLATEIGDQACYWGPEGTESDDYKYPTFIGPAPGEQDATKKPVLWTYPKTVRYLLFKHNKDEKFVKNCPGSQIDEILVAKIPVEDTTFFDPADPETYETAPIVTPDKPATGKDVAGTIRDLIRGKGFEVRFVLDHEPDGMPITTFEVFEPRTEPLVDVWLQPRFTKLDLNTTNLFAMRATKDLSSIENDYEVRGDLEECEAYWILAPMFPSNVADASSANLLKYKKSRPGFNEPFAYRYWIFDETGQGHYAIGSNQKKTNVSPTIKYVVGWDPIEEKYDDKRYVNRLRKPLPNLCTNDPRGNRAKPTLEFSYDYAGPYPAVAENVTVPALGGTWYPIVGSWQMLKDQIGIHFTGEDPNHWQAGPTTVLKTVEAYNSVHNVKPFHLRLRCAVNSDRRVIGTANVKFNSILEDTVRRVIDAQDRYSKRIVTTDFSTGDPPTVIHDDTKNATAEAQALQAVTQNGVFESPLVIPRFTNAYKKGMRIRGVYGRGLGFRTNADDDETVPTYPNISSIVWRNDDAGISTTLFTSDADAARATITGVNAARRFALPKRPSPSQIMSNPYDEMFRLRHADTDAEIDGQLAQLQNHYPGATRAIGQILSNLTTANVFYKVKLLTITGDEAENAPATFTADVTEVFAFNLGTSAPPAGRIVTLTHVPDRWVFTHGNPATLTVTNR